jgi:DNA repair exonuclease SbcCD ATPase subunit
MGDVQVRLIITGDIQCDWDNLHLCEQAWTEIVSYAERQRMDAIIVAGDMKRVYSPVDVRVTNWWSDAIKRAVAKDIQVLIDLGNHDRVGQYTDAVNWFPVMRNAGAICVDDGPQVLKVGDGKVAMLPFCSSKSRLREWSQVLQGAKADVLIFHEDLKGCRYNQTGQASEAKVEPEDLFPSSYRYCIGGHIHLRQKIGKNIYYTGSPFCQDWGESNQRKSYTVITDEGIRFLPSSIPGWFDPTWPGFYEPRDWAGAKVRVHVRCVDGVDYLRRIDKARRRAEDRYRGATIHISPDFEKGGGIATPNIRADDPDEVKIKEYVKETCPDNISGEKAVKYLIHRVAQVSGRWVRGGSDTTFIGAKAENFLGYKNLTIRFDKPGLFVVQGKNHDKGGSNGSGKTSILQTIPVALFGTTFKGQKADKWARRHSVEKANVVLTLRDSLNRIIKVKRQRRPTQVKLWVDGKDESAGLQPQQKDGTQGLIESASGFAWQTLANAVYIDQTVARAFLAGRKSDRTAVLSQFQNLERFARALKLVRRDRTAVKDALEGQKRNIAVLEERIAGYKRTLSLMVSESQERVEEARNAVDAASSQKSAVEERVRPLLDSINAEIKEAEKRYKAATAIQNEVDHKIAVFRERQKQRKTDALKLLKASSFKQCPTCNQMVDSGELKSAAAVLEESAEKIGRRLDVLGLERSAIVKKVGLLEAEHDEIAGKLIKLERKLTVVQLDYEHAEKQYREIKRREHDAMGRNTIQDKLLRAKNNKQEMEVEESKLVRRDELLAYCEKALSRDGIPAFLNALLCGPLNLAGEYYAELFCRKAVQVRFDMEDGEFVPQIINATGGEDMGDQSDGEKALAGVIASFALREIAPKCNLLILDEPGHGLDPVAAREFAIGLKELKKKFKTIFVTTHNRAMLAEWGDEQTILVEKRNSISQIHGGNV